MKSWVLEQIYHQRLLPHHIEYLKLDRDLLVLDTSKQVQRFAACPEEVIQNKDVPTTRILSESASFPDWRQYRGGWDQCR